MPSEHMASNGELPYALSWSAKLCPAAVCTNNSTGQLRYSKFSR
ncbi:hypothetical protein [Streptomyces sp. NPDC053560]